MTWNTPTTKSAQPGSSSLSAEGLTELSCVGNGPTTQPDQDNRLQWLHLSTRTRDVQRALNTLFTQAMGEGSDSQRAGLFLLSLWSPSRYPLDLSDLGFFERELNYACRHLSNFIIACQVNFRTIVTYSQIAPVIAAWGDQEDVQ